MGGKAYNLPFLGVYAEGARVCMPYHFADNQLVFNVVIEPYQVALKDEFSVLVVDASVLADGVFIDMMSLSPAIVNAKDFLILEAIICEVAVDPFFGILALGSENYLSHNN